MRVILFIQPVNINGLYLIYLSSTTLKNITHCQALVNYKALYEIQFEFVFSVAMMKVSNAYVTTAEN